MIIFDLICDRQHEFEGWFRNADDLNQQQSNGLLTCPVCNSEHVIKKLSAPKISKIKQSSKSPSSKPSKPTIDKSINRNEPTSLESSSKAIGSKESFNQLQTMLKKVHDYVETNFEDVGHDFAKKAIRMHKGEEEPTNIYGKANSKELKELKEEGVSAVPLPIKPIDKDKLN